MTSVGSDETLRDVRKLYERDLLSVKEISRRLAIPRSMLRNFLVAHGLSIRTKREFGLLRRNRLLPREDLQRFYQQERLSATRIAKRLGCSRQHIVNRLKELKLPLRDAVETSTIYPKVDFDGDRTIRAYLLGFRIGDLHVKRLNRRGRTIWVECASTRREQIDLCMSLFRPYGRCWTGSPKKNRARGVHALLNDSFNFLLPKARSIDPWILKGRDSFAAFLAGYIDAEGHFAVYHNHPVFAIQSYDRQILVQIASRLLSLGIQCRPPWIAAQPGTLTNGNGYSNRKTVWRFQIARRQALVRLIQLIKPYVQHRKRKHDMLLVEGSAQRSI